MESVIQHAEFWLFLVVPICSGLASIVNGAIRQATEGGAAVAPWILKTAAVLNFLAVNLDKGAQLWRGYRGKSLPAAT